MIQLIHATAGDRRGWREVRVPSVQAGADRHLQREWETVREDRKRIRNRIIGLLVTQGVTVEPTRHFVARLQTLQLWDGSGLSPELTTRLEREWTHLHEVEARLTRLRQLRRARVQSPTTLSATKRAG